MKVKEFLDALSSAPPDAEVFIDWGPVFEPMRGALMCAVIDEYMVGEGGSIYYGGVGALFPGMQQRAILVIK